jgi:nicotinate-nucleotide pyrophosphorylase
LKKFNETAWNTYFKKFVEIKVNVDKEKGETSSYFIFSGLFKESIFSEYFETEGKKFGTFEMSGNLSEETMKWIADQGVDVLDEEDL